jgi:hypothetical protein
MSQEKKQTVLMQSIDRKKQRVKKIQASIEKLHSSRSENRMLQEVYFATIQALEIEIQEDEKLRDQEREDLIDAYQHGMWFESDNHGHSYYKMEDPEKCFNEKFQQ